MIKRQTTQLQTGQGLEQIYPRTEIFPRNGY